MLVKLALGNVRRSVHDFSVYFLTLALAACLLYSFLASTDYLLALDLTAEQRAHFAQAGGVLQAFAVFVVVIFAFLVGYANVFLLRRRRREFGIYVLLGMGQMRVATVLALESGVVGAASFVAGVGLGALLSPAFGLVAAFVFGVPWRPVATFSVSGAVQCLVAFAVITALAALRAVWSVRRRSLVELMRSGRVPERRRLAGVRSVRGELVVAAALLAVVWGTCLLNPGYFIVFIVPMGFIALGGTYLLLRVLGARIPEWLRQRPDRYWSGLHLFTVRQVESRVESGCAALSAVCVLMAAGMCMVVAGLAFSVGVREGSLFGSVTTGLEPIAFACIFYGAAFLVSAAAVLALQQLSQASDTAAAYRTLDVLGVRRGMVRSSILAQVVVSFAVPGALSCVHCIFGFTLIGMLTLMSGAVGFMSFAAGTLAFTAVTFALYYAVTARTCVRALLPRALA
ncbi:FtsX-like permease family protein [Collinsella sp. An2]|uniref:FtsX-like permease family protein n=1 Tax=Collinsella sp. An2 TaxID=1965585 RepID=UPI000B3852AF|nr:FtsX-like permease family protein [Collinsella sp. An2]OUP11153.1 hypothetical protein B5F33_01940 [Collinsella sp. An2]